MSQPTTPTPATTTPADRGVAHPGERASIWRVLRDQRKTLYVGAAFVVASFWVFGQLGRWGLAGCVAGGVVLGLVNHLATELWLLRTITSGREISRNEMIGATLVRLLVLSVVAVTVAVVFWPDGIGLLLGLAIFRLIALMMTSVSLLKELKS
ncbi:hypothetical protein D9V37_03670 [Nocardioides mangrovicus]|uniref:ATP synthase subunit I n=1 Tax=Nocardioides mangrovicus TaxID=2478913 RepID=A0A3L8P8I0_9ACTN|nr:hypothetical protein [Nocardioides mangrovicus]RLV51029.1 hypothetical protein D9V37_03670 [Nocardioides mangrovicus]